MSLVLLVDDESEALLSLSRILKLKDSSLTFEAATNPDAALQLVAQKDFDLAVVDLNLDNKNGVESGFQLLEKILTQNSALKVIVLTGNSSIENGVRALRMGASHFLEKPAEISHLLALITDCVRQREIFRLYSDVAQQNNGMLIDRFLVGKHKSMETLRQELRFAATTNQPVLLLGETGTGKTLCASLIHRMSPRTDKKFITYTSSYLNADLVSSEIFGHQKGAFTGATECRQGLLMEANSGTFFADEIDEMPHDVQVSLLKVLQSKNFRVLGSNKEEVSDFRLISASNRPEAELLESGKLRADFFHRIAHQIIRIPALRERVSDIKEIALSILENLSNSEGLKIYTISQQALRKLESYEWPGNIRELESVVAGAAYRARFCDRNIIDSEDLVYKNQSQAANEACNNFHELVESYKIKLVENALRQTDNNQVQAAKLLGLDRSSLRRIIEK